ncbi:MAG: EAL domain-containing protein [Gammaproteobacteria bacterium]|nr:EAL domain-containing protein [Gammaproteobacteria bacterium]
MAVSKKLLKHSRLQGLFFAALVLLGGVIVMLADLQTEKKKFLNYSDLIYQGLAQRLLTAEGVITALVTFGQDDDIDGNSADSALQELVQTYPYIYALTKLDWVRYHERRAYEKTMQENGMAGMLIREHDQDKDIFIKARRRNAYLVTSLVVPMEPVTSQLLGLDLLVNNEVEEAVYLAMKNSTVSLINSPKFLNGRPGLVMLKNTYFGRLHPESLLESKRQINGAVMLYIDQKNMLSSIIKNFPNIDIGVTLLDINLSESDKKVVAENQENVQKILPTMVTFTQQRVIRVANRDVLLNVTGKYSPGLMQMIIAVAVMLLIAIALRMWSSSRKQQMIASVNQEKAFQDLFSERERAEVTLSSITDAVITTDDHDKITFLNPVAEKFMGVSNDDAFGKPINDVLQLVDEQSKEGLGNPLEYCLEKIAASPGGKSTHILAMPDEQSPLSVDLSCSKLKDIHGNEMGSVIVMRDVTHERELKNQLSYQASHDSLTGLVNRAKFEDELKKAILTCNEDAPGHVLCYMDLDQFKVVNDTCGHIAGDALLKQLSQLLCKRTRDSDVLARLGGDEFGLLLSNCNLENAMPIANALRLSVRQFIFRWDGRAFEVRISIGVVAINDPNSTHAELMSAADVACYIAKESGRDFVHAYKPEEESVTQHHELMQWSQKIQDALRTDKFHLMLQTMAPLLSAQADIQVQEFLLRIRMDDGSIATPATFIPAAERYGLMRDVDMWVIEHCFDIIHDIRNDTDSSVTYLYSINLSGQSVGDPEISEFITRKIKEYDIDPSQIMLEITETAAITNFQTALDFIDRLSDIGCRFALDDFGAGLSSFGYLKRMKVDFLKIDGQFVKGMAEDPIDRMMVNNITHLAYGLGLFVIAESVEDAILLEMLRDIGVHFAQGYHIQRPTSIEEWKKENMLKTIFMRTVH